MVGGGGGGGVVVVVCPSAVCLSSISRHATITHLTLSIGKGSELSRWEFGQAVVSVRYETNDG